MHGLLCKRGSGETGAKVLNLWFGCSLAGGGMAGTVVSADVISDAKNEESDYQKYISSKKLIFFSICFLFLFLF